MKKAQVGISASSSTPSLRKGQYKRLGRVSADNPERAERIANRMVERKSRVARGKAFAAPKLASAFAPKPAMKKGGKVASKKK